MLLAKHHPWSVGVGSFAPVLYPTGVGVPEGEDVEMMHPVVLGMDTFCLMVDLDGAFGVDHEDSPFCW